MKIKKLQFLYKKIFIFALVPAVTFIACLQKTTTKSDTAADKTNPSTPNKQQIHRFPSIIDSAVGWEFQKDSIPSWSNVLFDFDTEDPTEILTFRGGFQRNSPVINKITITPKSLKSQWFFETRTDTMKGKYGYWGGGAGWTGQPLLLHWSSSECKTIESLYPKYQSRNKDLKEIIQISLSGYVYFIDLETGSKTRDPLYISNPIKGTPSIDPEKKFLLVGQGIPHRNGFHWRCFDLRTGKLLHEEKTPSSFALRGWGASDASPLFTQESKFIWPTESGVVYFGQASQRGMSQLTQAHYRITAPSKQGTESSPSAFANLMYLTDNGGTVICFDISSMKPRWHYKTGDDIDASPVIDVENGIPYVYVGNEVDKQGDKGTSSFFKLHGLTGEKIWVYSKRCNSTFGKKPNNGGILSTCVIGKGKLQPYIWTVFSRVDSSTGGNLVCLNKQNGKIKYQINLKQYSWVSPIILYNKDGNGYVYLADVGGNIYLFNAENGDLIFKKNIGMTFESSPIAWKNLIIQPARGNQILCFQIE